MTGSSFLSRLQTMFDSALQQSHSATNFDEHQDNATLESALIGTRAALVSTLLKSFRLSAPKMLRERRSQLKEFEKRNFRRWKSAFDLLETVVVMAEELGQCCAEDVPDETQEKPDYKSWALSQVHPRAVLVAREILCLLKGGFPDAALSRWRSLHELTVTAMFIAREDQNVARNYLASFSFRALRAASEYNRYAQRANLEPFAEEQIAYLEKICGAAERQIGRRLKSDYDWAQPDGHAKRFTFRTIEEKVGMDHWRPRYRWASQHIHAGHRPADALLGLAESNTRMFLVGPSNSGFTDPFHMTAISLAQVTSTFLLHKPNLDRLVYQEVILQLAEEIGPIAQNLETETLSNYKQDRMSR